MTTPKPVSPVEAWPARNWPHDPPHGWNLDAAKFVAMVQGCPMLWLKLSKAKYLELRIDTRDGGFNLFDRDRNPLNPDDVMAAIREAQEEFGEASQGYRSTGDEPR